ncbi:MAG TPA: adenylate/guanylate cyclase domain-containing protein [Candidatus Limnocylindrales bacterium]|nr:adenylate/guanylate cyclase domain-containing protein [Candidatus Limnocylindrales bacterium]
MALPTGPAVTFLFTDIEGSTRSERAAGSTAWAAIVGRHDALLRTAIEQAGGVVVKTEGDAFFAAFGDPGSAARAAVAAQRAVAAEGWPAAVAPLRVRMGMHLGEGRLRHGLAAADPEDYVGIDVNYAARIAAAGNGGQIVVSDVLARAIAGAIGGDDATLTDEGLRAVKDFDEPIRLHRLVVPGAADDARPLRTLDPPTNLPGEVTALVGRAGEISQLSQLLAQTRILTLTGPGGSGKTRLALGVAQSVRDRFPHGTWFVDLASVRDPGLVEPLMAATLGLRDSGDRSLADVLRAHLRDRTALLVLDNLEQLLPDAATTVATLVRAAPETRLLITSRELLRIAGEQGHTVPPLDIQAGVELFEARATALRPDLQLTDDTRATITTICERLNGLPLAIELAAARVRMLSPQLILERLSSSLDLSSGSRDLPERQRTLRGAIDWSHDLLSDPERRLFRRLSVFAGGWTAELAEAVTNQDGDVGIDVFDGLESLADKSLVRIEPAGSGEEAADEPRFSTHPLLREYAAERLEAAGERAATEARHAAAIGDLVGLVGEKILGPGGARAIRRIDLEQHNVRKAIDWAAANSDIPLGIRSIAPIWRWYQQRGRLREGRALLAPLLAAPGMDPRLRIAALEAEGGLAYWSDDVPAAQAAYDERLALAEQLGDKLLIADAHYDLGFMSVIGNDPPKLRDHEQLAYDLYESLGDERNMQRTRQALALAFFLTGEYTHALELEEVNLAAFRAAKSDYQIADSMTFHAGAFFRLGKPRESWEYVVEGLRWFAEHDNASGLARAIGMAAIVLLDYGDVEFGTRVTGATMQLVREKSVLLAPVKVLHLPDPTETAIAKLGEARARELLDEGAATPIEVVTEQLLAMPAPSAPEPSAG